MELFAYIVLGLLIAAGVIGFGFLAVLADGMSR